MGSWARSQVRRFSLSVSSVLYLFFFFSALSFSLPSTLLAGGNWISRGGSPLNVCGKNKQRANVGQKVQVLHVTICTNLNLGCCCCCLGLGQKSRLFSQANCEPASLAACERASQHKREQIVLLSSKSWSRSWSWWSPGFQAEKKSKKKYTQNKRHAVWAQETGSKVGLAWGHVSGLGPVPGLWP